MSKPQANEAPAYVPTGVLILLLAGVGMLGCRPHTPAASGQQTASPSTSARESSGSAATTGTTQQSTNKDTATDAVSLRDSLQGKWVGDREAYKKANPNDSVGDAVNAFLEYSFADAKMQFGTAFDKKEANYKVVQEEKDRLKIEITVDNASKYAWVTFVDKDHIKLIWEPGTDKDKQAHLKRAKE